MAERSTQDGFVSNPGALVADSLDEVLALVREADRATDVLRATVGDLVLDELLSAWGRLGSEVGALAAKHAIADITANEAPEGRSSETSQDAPLIVFTLTDSGVLTMADRSRTLSIHRIPVVRALCLNPGSITSAEQIKGKLADWGMTSLSTQTVSAWCSEAAALINGLAGRDLVMVLNKRETGSGQSIFVVDKGVAIDYVIDSDVTPAERIAKERYSAFVSPDNVTVERSQSGILVPVIIRADNEAVLPGGVVRLMGHGLFIFNALMDLRGSGWVSAQQIKSLGFQGTSGTFVMTMERLRENTSRHSGGWQIILAQGEGTGRRYRLNEFLEFEDTRDQKPQIRDPLA